MIYVLSGGGTLTTIIAVTYPAGSICTCGGKAAKDTSGYALFNVKAGTYTVECHTSDNSKSKSTSVTVAESDKGKAIDVTLTYALVLFDNGTYAAETGGWTDIKDNTLYKSVYGSSPYENTLGYLSTVNLINLSDYSKLYFVVSSFNSASGLAIGVSPTKGTANDFSASYKFTNGQSSSDETIYSVDISSVASGYIKARLSAVDHNTSEIRITKVYAE